MVESVFDQVRHKKREGSLYIKSNGIAFLPKGSDETTFHIPWPSVVKHQVSPASYPKALLKILLQGQSPLTFQFGDRTVLDRARQDVSIRRKGADKPKAPPPPTTPFYSNIQDPTALAVTRASLLSANPSLREQYKLLVPDTLSEEDFWSTHHELVEDSYARQNGLRQAGTSSLLQSHLPLGKTVTLGVEEMRQIFILYPAVHKAYEEKVPLELSEEQFWRKYLESEYFHRDRGRMGSASQGGDTKKTGGLTQQEQEARAAVVGTDDLFSRYDQKLRQEEKRKEEEAKESEEGAQSGNSRKWGRTLAVGQFDLASTFATERGKLLEGPKDNHPDASDDGKGARVISKYNRHWAMVLHPNEAVAGSDLTKAARKSAQEEPVGDDAKAGGGMDKEMRKLVDFASTSEDRANHASGVGDENSQLQPLMLENVDAYFKGHGKRNREDENGDEEEAAKRYKVLTTSVVEKTKAMVDSLVNGNGTDASLLPPHCFPSPKLGLKLLQALTGKMAQDARTDSESMAIVDKLPSEFRDQLQNHFKRSSELLRHFFGLRRLEAKGSKKHSDKLARIVKGMETFYREMEKMRKGLPQTESGEVMRKMCLPIMKQLDWAFKLHREGSGGSGGGFVTVETF